MGDMYVVSVIGWFYWPKSRIYWYAVRSSPVDNGSITLIMLKIYLFKTYTRFKMANHSLLIEKTCSKS